MRTKKREQQEQQWSQSTLRERRHKADAYNAKTANIMGNRRKETKDLSPAVREAICENDISADRKQQYKSPAIVCIVWGLPSLPAFIGILFFAAAAYLFWQISQCTEKERRIIFKCPEVPEHMDYVEYARRVKRYKSFRI